MVGKNQVLPYCYKDYRILDNGPLRFTVELTYNPSTIGDMKNVNPKHPKGGGGGGGNHRWSTASSALDKGGQLQQDDRMV